MEACQESLELETFPYGDKAVEINVTVPVIRCTKCAFVFTDQRAEQARHRAVCEFLGLLAPEDIKRIRKTVLGMTRETFHAAYGLSQASVERWENGKLLQGEAADTLIRALEDTSLALKLDRRSIAESVSQTLEQNNVVWGRFPSLETDKSQIDDALIRSKDFFSRVNAG
ncbi:MAG: hypothetical protein EOO61_05325 [Hymenobacter sp.]|nr:MAG: hypothetical protein EOO61_05325 [Hymenobacter sp.]